MQLWHGSAAAFDHFDSSHFLSGEGSMFYGAGHYARKGGKEIIIDENGQPKLVEKEEDIQESRKKKRVLEAVSFSQGESYQPTAISSTDVAKILEKIQSTKEKYKNISNRADDFIRDVAQAIGTKQFGSKSQYATFEAKNGKVVTIRLSDHNATVSNFDNHGEDFGISIVITPKKLAGIVNDGYAHIKEFHYDSIKLRKADGKPLVGVLESIEQALYSGDFKDKTGLAVMEEVNIPVDEFEKGIEDISNSLKTDPDDDPTKPSGGKPRRHNGEDPLDYATRVAEWQGASAKGGISALNAKQPKRINTNIDFSDIKTEPVTIDADEQQSLKRSIAEGKMSATEVERILSKQDSQAEEQGGLR